MNFYDMNRRAPSQSSNYYAKKGLTMPRQGSGLYSSHARENSGSQNQHPDNRLFDAKKLYKDRLQTFNVVKNKRKLDFTPAKEEYRRTPNRSPLPDDTNDEYDEW